MEEVEIVGLADVEVAVVRVETEGISVPSVAVLFSRRFDVCSPNVTVPPREISRRGKLTTLSGIWSSGTVTAEEFS